MKRIILLVVCILSFQTFYAQSCGSTIMDLATPAQTSICTDGSNLPAFTAPPASLPDVQIVVETNGTITIISNNGIFFASSLNPGDEICYTAFTYDLDSVQTVLNTAATLCPALDVLLPDLMPCSAIADLQNGVNDGVPGLNSLEEILDFAGSLGNPITSVEDALLTLENLNETIGALGLGVCYATSNSVCLPVIDCTDPMDCEEEITGGITSAEQFCDLSNINIIITAPDGTGIIVTTDSDGNFTVPNGPYPCGTYSAAFENPAVLPACYTDAGSINSISFEVDGDMATDDGPFFIANPLVPTLSQWGLIILALLLMSFGALTLSTRTTQLKYLTN